MFEVGPETDLEIKLKTTCREEVTPRCSSYTLSILYVLKHSVPSLVGGKANTSFPLDLVMVTDLICQSNTPART